MSSTSTYGKPGAVERVRSRIFARVEPDAPCTHARVERVREVHVESVLFEAAEIGAAAIYDHVDVGDRLDGILQIGIRQERLHERVERRSPRDVRGWRSPDDVGRVDAAARERGRRHDIDSIGVVDAIVGGRGGEPCERTLRSPVETERPRGRLLGLKRRTTAVVEDAARDSAGTRRIGEVLDERYCGSARWCRRATVPGMRCRRWHVR